MPEINYKALEEYLKEPQGKDFFPVYLFFGEESLFKTAFDTLLDALLPLSERGFNYEPVDGTDENIQTVIERMNTFSLLSGTKVIAFHETRIFYSKQDYTKLFEKAKEAFFGDDLKGASNYHVNALGRLNLSYDEFVSADKTRIVTADVLDDGKWLDEINQYCKDHELAIPSGGDRSDILDEAIHKGFPKGNHLIITTDFVDKRRRLFKTFQKSGLVIDCSVPKGDRRDDRIAQEAVLREETEGILSRSGKTIEKDAFIAAVQMTGFEIRTFCNNIEKLVDYIGERKEITVEDVESVLKRTKQDPIYELTSALGERNLQNSLFYLDSLLSDNYHPLQVLSAITNQMRRLLVARDFLESEFAGSWTPGIQFPQFRNNVFPHIKEYDQKLLEQVHEWEDLLNTDPGSEERKTKKRKKKASTDLLLARSSGSPYPVYKTLQQADSYTEQEIVEAFHQLHDADVKLKSTGQNAKLILESALFKICGSTEEMKTASNFER